MNTASSTSSAVAAATATTTATATSMAHATATTTEPASTATTPDDWFALDATNTTASTPLYDVATLRAIEQAGLDSLPPFTLMARAGAAAADWIARHAPAGKVLCLAGAGNNGGDALVAATRLHQAGRRVEAWLTGVPDRLPADAARAWAEARAAGVPVLAMAQDESAALPPWPADCVAIADGLLGIGLNRPAQGQAARWIEHVNASGLPVFALDIPSGLFADTGVGQPAIRAQRTLTFLTAKPGLLTLDGRDCAGALDIAPLGLAYPPMQAPSAIVNQPAGFAATLPTRVHAANKGHFGQLAVIGGSIGMTGAPLLGARAALYLGAGRVHIGFLADNAPSVDVVHPELMLHPVARVAIDAMSALVVGPGMGTGAESATVLTALLDACVKADHPPALVLDADALNLLATDAALAARLTASGLHCVLTPHPLEAARLLGSSVAEVQRDRLAAATALARQWHAVVVLKGSGTIIAAPYGNVAGEDARDPGATAASAPLEASAHDRPASARAGAGSPLPPPPAINPTGNAALATAGTGDVLAGMTGALLAQGMTPHAAACAAVWIHGRAADAFVAAGLGPAGMTASELYGPARQILNALLRGAPT